jgi:hypothetical protein
MGCFLRSIVCVLGVIRLLFLSKLPGGIKSIAMDEVLYGWSIKPYVFSSVMCFLLIYWVISLVWQLRAGVKWWCKVFEPLWMSIPIGQRCKWMWQTHFITSCVRQCSLLFVLFMPNNYHCSLILIPLRESCLLSFHLWARIRVIRFLGLFLF